MSKTLGEQAFECWPNDIGPWGSYHEKGRWESFATEFRNLVLAELSPGLRMVMERLEQHREAGTALASDSMLYSIAEMVPRIGTARTKIVVDAISYLVRELDRLAHADAEAEAKRTPGQVAADAYREAFCKTGGDLQLAFSAAAAAVLEHAKAVKETP